MSMIRTGECTYAWTSQSHTYVKDILLEEKTNKSKRRFKSHPKLEVYFVNVKAIVLFPK